MNCLTFIGYESGEFCIFDFFDEEYFARTIGHKLKITAIDFSALTGYILTASQDSFVKIWKFEQDASEVYLYSTCVMFFIPINDFAGKNFAFHLQR